jgi:hypothetical protein
MKTLILEGVFEDKIKDARTAQYLKSIDPSNGKYLDWITKQYLTPEKSEWETFESELKGFLEAFLQYSKSRLLKKEETQIWNYPTIDALRTKLEEVEDKTSEEYIKFSKKQEKKKFVKQGYQTVFIRYHCQNCGANIDDSKELKAHSCSKDPAEVSKEKDMFLAKQAARKITYKQLKASGKLNPIAEEEFKDFLSSTFNAKTQYSSNELITKGLLNATIQIIKLENIDAVNQYCNSTTWCITKPEQYTNYTQNLGCNFYLMVNHAVEEESPCYKFLVVVFPNWYINLFTQFKGHLQGLVRHKEEIQDEVFRNRITRLEKYVDLIDEFKSPKDKTFYEVYTSTNKVMSFSTFLKAFHLEKQRNLFEIPVKEDITNEILMLAQQSDKVYASEDSVYIRKFTIGADKVLTRDFDEKVNGTSKKMEMYLKKTLSDVGMGELSEIANSYEKSTYMTSETLDTNTYCDNPTLKWFRRYKFYKLRVSDAKYNAYMGKDIEIPFTTVFFLIDKEDEDTFYVIRYKTSEDYMHNQNWQLFNYVEAAYVDAEVDEKLAYYCPED